MSGGEKKVSDGDGGRGRGRERMKGRTVGLSETELNGALSLHFQLSLSSLFVS